MSNTCVSCHETFGTKGAFDQHLRSQRHAARRLADQLQRDQNIASPSVVSNGKGTPVQLRRSASKVPSKPEWDGPYQLMTIELRPKVVVKQQPHQLSCTSCNKTFKNQDGVRQHLRYSKAHGSSLPPKRSVTTIVAAPNPNTLAPTPRISLPPKIIGPSTISAEISSSSCRLSFQKIDPTWSSIQPPEYAALLEGLSRNCHTQQDLQKNKYILRPYDNQLSPVPRSTIPAHQTRHFAKQVAHYKTFATSPAPTPQKPAFQAITLDCEMAQITGSKQEVILVCAIDYFTGAVLLNKLVCPTQPVSDWKTDIHGIGASSIAKAVSQGVALTGWKEAREELWKLIDQDTILVGHALQYDLEVLHMIHTCIVDSAILTCNVVARGDNQFGLKTLAKELLGIEIRDNKGGIHDCLEDLLATREVVLWCTRNTQQLEAWAIIKRPERERKNAERKAWRQRSANKKSKAKKPKSASGFGARSARQRHDSEDEVVRWEDIAEEYAYPGYDPWSD